MSFKIHFDEENVYVSCLLSERRVTEIFSTSKVKFGMCDLIVSTTGSVSLERRGIFLTKRSLNRNHQQTEKETLHTKDFLVDKKRNLRNLEELVFQMLLK